ncbi:hypothetical protein GCM10010399_24840 [Dactylosporangium fulvum]
MSPKLRSAARLGLAVTVVAAFCAVASTPAHIAPPVATLTMTGEMHELLLAELQGAGRLDWSRAVVDSFHVRATRRGPKRPSGLESPRPDRGRRHPLAVPLAGGNRNDVTQWEHRDDIHEAFLTLAMRIITYRHVVRLCQELQVYTDGQWSGMKRVSGGHSGAVNKPHGKK